MPNPSDTTLKPKEKFQEQFLKESDKILSNSSACQWYNNVSIIRMGPSEFKQR